MWSAKQQSELIAGQLPCGAVGEDRDGAAVGVGIVGNSEVSARVDGELEHKVHGAGLFGIGERDGREVGVRIGLLGHHGWRRKSPAGKGFQHGRAADAVQRCVRDRHLTIRQQRTACDGGEVVALDVRVERHEGLGQRQLRSAGRGGDSGFDKGVLRRDDLDGAEVDLVAVVDRRVVARGHHDPRVGAAGARAIRQHRGR